MAAAALSPASCSEASERGDEPRDAKAGASGGAATPRDADAGTSGGATALTEGGCSGGGGGVACSPLGDAGVAAAALSPPSCSEGSERGDEPSDAKGGASGGAAAPNDANAGASGGAAEPSGAAAGPSGVAAGASGTGGGLNHAYPEPTGRAAQGLALYRKRLAELEAVKQAKPDMVAFKELRKQWTPANVHGHISDVPVGVRLNGRGEAAILGLHTAIVSGIMFTTGVPAYAICLSGAYEDDRDDNDDGTIQYTGAGGMEKGKQTKDQENTRGNAALVLSNKCGTPVRVLRGRIVKKKREGRQGVLL